MRISGFLQKEPDIVLDRSMVDKIKNKVIKDTNKDHRKKLQGLRSSNTRITNSLQKTKEEVKVLQECLERYDLDIKQYLSTIEGALS